MRSITKEQSERKAALVSKLQTVEAKLSKEVAQYNADVKVAFEKLAETVEEYDLVLDEAHELAEEIKSDLENFYGDKSEAWQDGDKGKEFQEWIAAWETVEHGGNAGVFCHFEVEELEEVEAPTDTPSDELEALPEEPGVIS